jgi:hypothetical protein
MKNDTVFAVTTSGGIILLDSAEDYAVEAEVVEGLKKLGLDPASIKYNVVTASHTSSYGGAKFLQEHFFELSQTGRPSSFCEQGCRETLSENGERVHGRSVGVESKPVSNRQNGNYSSEPSCR